VTDGGTAVIAGLMNNSTRLEKNGVPGLAKMGGLGKLFSNKNKSEISKQIYVFVTPRLLTGKEPEDGQPTAENGTQEPAPVTMGGEGFKKDLAESIKRLGKG